MKKLLVTVLVLAIIISNNTFVNAASNDPVDSNGNLTSYGKERAYEEGWPRDYKTGLNKMWDIWTEIVDVGDMGSFTQFGSFIIFIQQMSEENDAPFKTGNQIEKASDLQRNSKNDLSDFSIVVRAIYDEVSNHGGTREADVLYIGDILKNRVKYYNKTWSDFLEAGAFQGMNSINPGRVGKDYWMSNNVKKPLIAVSDADDNEARRALILAYTIMWDRYQYGWNPVYDPYFSSTSLGNEYVYFNKSKTTPTSNPHTPDDSGFYYHKAQ